MYLRWRKSHCLSLPTLPQFMQYFHYDGVKHLNRLNENGVSMNPSPISEIIIRQKKKKKKKKKACRKANKICILFYFHIKICILFYFHVVA